jgi:hypothetical protein
MALHRQALLVSGKGILLVLLIEQVGAIPCG